MRYAIFDLDGTITDSMKYWRNFAKYFLIENGFSEDDGINDIERIDGTKWVEAICDFICTKYKIDVTPRSLYDWGLNFMRKRYETTIDFKPGARRLLDNLKEQGVKMCICSSTDKELMQPALDRLDLNKYFEFTLHCRQFGKEKNNPETFEYCMKKLGASSPDQVAVFEDALYSASTAHAAGFYVVGMFDDTENSAQEMKKVCNQYVTDFAQLDYSDLPE